MDSVSCLTWNMTVAMHYKTKTTLSIKTLKKTKQIENAGRPVVKSDDLGLKPSTILRSSLKLSHNTYLTL